MNGIAVLLSLAAVGVDYGWQPGVDGQLEYIIQIEPTLLGSLESGREIVSEIHPEARGVRRIRIRVGTAALPKVSGVPAGTSPTRRSTSDTDPGNTLRENTPARSVVSDGDTALPSSSALTTSGILRLPPPPLLVGADGKASVLVPRDDRALPGIAPPGNTYSSTENGNVSPGYDAGGLGAPAARVPGGFSGGNGWHTPAISNDAVGPPPVQGSGFPTQPGNFWQGGLPNSLGNPAPVSPVPGPGPETGLPSPIHSSGIKPNNESLIEKMVAKSRTGQKSDSDLANQLADRRGDAAAQKPTLDEETAERLAQLQAEHPWIPLVLTSLALFGSLAGNAYLAWVAIGIYHRYRDMCEQLHEAQASLT
ncbi:MAG: hypothetical protein ACYC4U_10345 [Pirellulaceae bacterium]